MKRFGFAFFVGMALLFLGASVAFDALFGVHAIVRFAIAMALVGAGVLVIVRVGGRRLPGPESGEAWFADRHFAPAGQLPGDTRYDVVFGRGVIDLTHLEAPVDDVTVTVDAVFGAVVVRVDPSVPYDVAAHAAFGNVSYRAPADRAPHLHLAIHAVFGSCQVVEAPARIR